MAKYSAAKVTTATEAVVSGVSGAVEALLGVVEIKWVANGRAAATVARVQMDAIHANALVMTANERAADATAVRRQAEVAAAAMMMMIAMAPVAVMVAVGLAQLAVAVALLSATSEQWAIVVAAAYPKGSALRPCRRRKHSRCQSALLRSAT